MTHATSRLIILKTLNQDAVQFWIIVKVDLAGVLDAQAVLMWAKSPLMTI